MERENEVWRGRGRYGEIEWSGEKKSGGREMGTLEFRSTTHIDLQLTSIQSDKYCAPFHAFKVKNNEYRLKTALNNKKITNISLFHLVPHSRH